LKFRLHPVAHDEDDFIHALRVVELFPSVRHDWTSGDFQPELVHVRTHACALPGGNDDGTVHDIKVEGYKLPVQVRVGARQLSAFIKNTR
jgi:hypothetical protein